MSKTDSFTIQPGKPPLKIDERGNFLMRGYDPDTINTYDCEHCKAVGITHEVQSFADGATDMHSNWGPGIPTTIRVCSGCGRWDGGWVSTDSVGGGW